MTVDEKRKLELKTMYQIIGIYCHNKHHTSKGHLCEDFVVYVKPIAMHLLIAKRSVKSCAMVGLECYWYHQYR